MRFRNSTGIRVLCLLALSSAVFILSANAVSGGLTLSGPGQIRPCAPEELSLSIPRRGNLSLVARQGGEEIPLILDLPVLPGDITLPFDGLTVLGEPLFKGSVTLIARLSFGGGAVMEAEYPLRVLLPAKALLYAVLSRETLPALGGEAVRADYQLTRAGLLDVTLYGDGPEQTRLKGWSIKREDALPHAFVWDKTIGGKPAAPGEYLLRFQMRDAKQEALECAFTLTEEQPIPLPLHVTAPGEFLPETMADDSVWRAMTAPIAVLDIGAIQHQRVFERPDPESAMLGRVHGQTAGLQVLELDEDGYALVRAAREGDGQTITGYVPMNRLKMVAPDTRFGLLVDKAAQTLTVYREGKKIGSLPVSTGAYQPGDPDYYETLTGAFLTSDRIAGFSQDGFRYDYALRIDGGNLIHQAGYRIRGGTRDFSVQRAMLGTIASHGCIRVDSRVSEDGLNAWWLYQNLPQNTKVLVVDGKQTGILDPLETLP
jgi:hypothetical protein